MEQEKKKRGRKPGTPKTGGRPKGAVNKVTADVKLLAQEYGPEAIQILVKIAREQEDNPQARIAACKELLARAYGQPKAEVEHTGTIKMVVLDDEAAD